MEDRKNNQKYVSLMLCSKELFWKHGFKRVSVQEICQKAGISKMTFYKFFKNKTELAKQVFTDEIVRGLEAFDRLIDSDIPVQEKLKQMLVLKAEGTQNISKEF